VSIAPEIAIDFVLTNLGTASGDYDTGNDCKLRDVIFGFLASTARVDGKEDIIHMTIQGLATVRKAIDR
jgi:hypothetical protein